MCPYLKPGYVRREATRALLITCQVGVTTPAVDMDYQYCVSLKLISLWTKKALCIGHAIILNLLGCTVCRSCCLAPLVSPLAVGAMLNYAHCL